MLQKTLDTIAGVPHVWNTLRWIAEAGYAKHHQAIHAALVPRDDINRRFLDFGCGTGRFSADFPSDRYVGIDLTRQYIAFAGTKRRGAFAVMNGTAVGLRAATFDAALVLGVFHHLPDDVAAGCIAELSRMLKPEATLLVIEDIPPPTIWNIPGHIMHWLDRGNNIRSDADYRRLWAPLFHVKHDYQMRSGICDYRVYILQRAADR